MLTPEQIDYRMAELGDLLFEVLTAIMLGTVITEEEKVSTDHIRDYVWERMKDVAEQAKKASGE